MNLTTIAKKLIKRISTFGMVETVNFGANTVALELRKRFHPQLVKRQIHKYEMYLDPSDLGLSRELFLNGTREQQLKRVLELHLDKGSVVLDLGANIGYYALLERQIIGPKGYIYALEPSASNVELLKTNIALNNAGSQIEPFHLGGSNVSGQAKFFLSSHSNLGTMIPELYKGTGRTKGTTDKFVMVDVVDLTSFIQGKKKIDLLRMDIEGFEVEVLEGLMPAVRSGAFTGKILFETHFPKYDDEKHSMRKQLKALFENGYEPLVLTSNEESRSKLKEKGYQPKEVIQTGMEKYQGIYYGVTKADAEHFLCDIGGVRDILLSKRA